MFLGGSGALLDDFEVFGKNFEPYPILYPLLLRNATQICLKVSSTPDNMDIGMTFGHGSTRRDFQILKGSDI